MLSSQTGCRKGTCNDKYDRVGSSSRKTDHFKARAAYAALYLLARTLSHLVLKPAIGTKLSPSLAENENGYFYVLHPSEVVIYRTLVASH